ncbi:MAG: fumarylacetoacetate hydrolase family protein [Thermodesulfobacteriota bacterium]|nr:fumarylacetoacetate hydrolase family protein [Thermodesulfobacteriota bacterium]
MHIIRFIDKNGQICFGHNYQDDTAILLEGRLFEGLKDSGRPVPVKKLLAPVQPPAILCIGLNYYNHSRELGAESPKYPVLFMKNPAAVNHPGDPIILPSSCMDPLQVDYEVELAVIIGKSAKDVPAEEALNYVLGYTIGNDVSARQWQKHSGGGQWVRSKSFDTFCPLGPEMVTTDEIPDPQTLQLKCFLNGQIMQDANTSDMIFPVATLIEYLSNSTTLLPGTVILTGTPGGVGFTRTPAVYLKPGDVVELTVEVIGTLINTVAGCE